jgi:hypothetical protein
MNYKDYKRKVKLAEVLDEPLEDDYLAIDKYLRYLHGLKRQDHHLAIDKYLRYLHGLKRQDHHNNFRTDISFTDNYNDLVIIEITLHNAVVLDYNLPTYLFKDKDEIESFLTEFINNELVDFKDGKRISIGKFYYSQSL